MPWVLYGGQGAPALWSVLHDEWSVQARGRLRLYALGYDAFQVMGVLASSTIAAGFDGLTGRLHATADGLVQRDVEWARIVAGRPQPAGVLPPPPIPSEP
jgi:outer membrane PBP1 activator LpoA protein